MRPRLFRALGEIGLEPQSLLVERAGLRRPARQEKSVAQVVERVRVVGCRREGRLELLDRGRQIAALCEQGAEVVAGLREVRLQGQGPLEGGPGLGGLTALHEKSPETVEGRRGRAALRRPLERHERGRLETLIQKLASVGEVVAHSGGGMERPRKRQAAREPPGSGGLDPGHVPEDLGGVHAVAVGLDDPPFRVEQEGGRQLQVLTIHEEMAVEDRVAEADLFAGQHDGHRRDVRGRGADPRHVGTGVEGDGEDTDSGPGESLRSPGEVAEGGAGRGGRGGPQEDDGGPPAQRGQGARLAAEVRQREIGCGEWLVEPGPTAAASGTARPGARLPPRSASDGRAERR